MRYAILAFLAIYTTGCALQATKTESGTTVRSVVVTSDDSPTFHQLFPKDE